MAPKEQDTTFAALSQDEFQALLQAQLQAAVRLALVTILEAEVDGLIGALPYERTLQRRDQRNGYYTRDLGTSMGRIEALPVPRTRKGYRKQLFKKYQRRRAELDAAISEMFAVSWWPSTRWARIPRHALRARLCEAAGHEFGPGEPRLSDQRTVRSGRRF